MTVDVRHFRTVARDRDRLTIPANTSASCSAHSLSIHPGLSDSLDALPHAPSVSAVEVVFYMLSVVFFMPFFRFDLVT